MAILGLAWLPGLHAGAFAQGDILPSNSLWSQLRREIWLAVVMGGLGICSFSWRSNRYRIHRALNSLLWMVWAGILFILAPGGNLGISRLTADYGIIISCVMTLPLVLDAFFNLGLLGSAAVLHSLIVWPVCAFLFVFAFVLWIRNILPSYYLAALIGILLAGGLLLWQYLFIQYNWYPSVLEKDKQITTPRIEMLLKIELTGYCLAGIGLILPAFGLPESNAWRLITALVLFATGYMLILRCMFLRWQEILKAQPG